MIKELVNDFIKSDFNQTTIVGAIEHRVGRKLIKGKDKVLVDYVDREDKESGQRFAYGAVIFEETVYGFLSIDYSEPTIVFTPSPELSPLK